METNLSQVLLVVSKPHVSNTPSVPGKFRCLVTQPVSQPQSFVKHYSNPDIFDSDVCICKPDVASVSSELDMVENHKGGTSLVQRAECLARNCGCANKQLCSLG